MLTHYLTVTYFVFVNPSIGAFGGRQPKLTAEQWAQAGRLIAAGETRKRVAIIYDVGVSTLYKKSPATDGDKSVVPDPTHPA